MHYIRLGMLFLDCVWPVHFMKCPNCSANIIFLMESEDLWMSFQHSQSSVIYSAICSSITDAFQVEGSQIITLILSFLPPNQSHFWILINPVLVILCVVQEYRACHILSYGCCFMIVCMLYVCASLRPSYDVWMASTFSCSYFWSGLFHCYRC